MSSRQPIRLRPTGPDASPIPIRIAIDRGDALFTEIPRPCAPRRHGPGSADARQSPRSFSASPARRPAQRAAGARPARGGEPDQKLYWDVKDIRPGMKGTGKTVMVGTKLEEFQVEVLGV